jgi:hypothetical protein
MGCLRSDSQELRGDLFLFPMLYFVRPGIPVSLQRLSDLLRHDMCLDFAIRPFFLVPHRYLTQQTEVKNLQWSGWVDTLWESYLRK